MKKRAERAGPSTRKSKKFAKNKEENPAFLRGSLRRMHLARIVSLDQTPPTPSAHDKVDKITGNCKSRIDAMSLLIYNMVDATVGLFLTIYGVYLFLKLKLDLHANQQTVFCFLILSTGILLVLCAVFSFTAMTNSGCRSCIHISKHLGIIVGSIAFGLGVAAVLQKKKTYQYIDENYADLGLNVNDKKFIENSYAFISYGLLVISLEQILRYRASANYYDHIVGADREYKLLEDREEDDWQTKVESNKSNRKEKYSDLKQQYRQKYFGNAETGGKDIDVETF